MQSRMIARRCAIPYALAHPARTGLNTEPILPTLPERIEQSRPPISFRGSCPLDGFTARAGIPPDSFLAAPIRIPRRGWIRGATPLDAAAPGAVSLPGTLPAFGGSRVVNRRRSDTRSADVFPLRVPGGGEAGR